MPLQQQTSFDFGRPRTVPEILATALKLYGQFPVLFLLLALAVVGPYDLIVLGVAHASPLGQESATVSRQLILLLVDFALVGPLVSALQVRALLMIGSERPHPAQVIRQSLRVLPVVAAAEIIAGIGIGIGLVLFILPGVILALRWAVVAQVAAVEGTNWPGTLRRSWALSVRNMLRILAVLLVIAVVNLTLENVVGHFAGTGRHPLQIVLGIAVATLTRSFQALTTAVLYFDLRARQNPV